MLTTDRVAGAALALLSLVVLWESRRLPLGSRGRRPSSGRGRPESREGRGEV